MRLAPRPALSVALAVGLAAVSLSTGAVAAPTATARPASVAAAAGECVEHSDAVGARSTTSRADGDEALLFEDLEGGARGLSADVVFGREFGLRR